MANKLNFNAYVHRWNCPFCLFYVQSRAAGLVDAHGLVHCFQEHRCEYNALVESTLCRTSMLAMDVQEGFRLTL